MHNHHLPLFHGSPAPDRCLTSSDRPFSDRISPSCGCHLHHLHSSSGSPHFLRTMEIGHSSCPSAASELRRGSSSSSSFAEDSRSVLRAACQSSELSRKFSVAECLFPSHNTSENTYVPRTPQINDFGATPVFQYEPASTAQFFPWAFKKPGSCEQNNVRMVSEPGHCMMRQQNQVKLYGWYLIKCSNDTAEVAVGGSLTPGAVGNGRHETATVTKRTEKCRLLTKDGVEVRLMGLIDDFATISNGFSVEIVHLFLSGFPYTWERLLENEIRMRNAKITAVPSPVPEKVDLSGIGISRLSVERGASSIEDASPSDGNQVDKLILNGQEGDVTQCRQISSQPLANESLQSTVANTGDEQPVNAKDFDVPINITEKMQSTEEPHEVTESAQATNDKANGVPFCQDESQGDSLGLQRETEKVQVLGSPVHQKEHMKKSTSALEKSAQKIHVSRRITRSMQRTGKPTGAIENENMDGVGKFPQLDVLHESGIESLTKELRDINTSPEGIPHTSVKMPGFHLMEYTRTSVKNNRHQSCTKESAVADAVNIECSANKEMIEDLVIVDDIAVEQVTLQFEQEAENLTHAIKRSCYQIIEEEGETENQTISGFTMFPKLGVSHEFEAENLSKEPSGMNASSESTTMTSLKTPGVYSTRSTRKPAKNKRRQICSKESSVDDAININCSGNNEMEENLVTVDDIEAEQIIAEIKQEAENLTHAIKGNCYQKIEKEAVHHPLDVESLSTADAAGKKKTESASIETLLSDVDAMDTTIGNKFHEGKEMHGSCRPGMIPPPLPCPRVSVSKRLISTAFGLKTSRSGRILVPPLAHWCSQSLIRDKDGGIIAISDGSMNTSGLDDGGSKFKPPAGANLQKLQKRLREAAIEGLKNRTKTKKKKTT